MAWPRLLVLGEHDQDKRAITPEAAPLNTRAAAQEQELSGALLMVPAELFAILTVELESQGFVCLLAWQLRVDVTRSSTSEVFSLWRI